MKNRDAILRRVREITDAESERVRRSTARPFDDGAPRPASAEDVDEWEAWRLAELEYRTAMTARKALLMARAGGFNALGIWRRRQAADGN